MKHVLGIFIGLIVVIAAGFGIYVYDWSAKVKRFEAYSNTKDPNPTRLMSLGFAAQPMTCTSEHPGFQSSIISNAYITNNLIRMDIIDVTGRAPATHILGNLDEDLYIQWKDDENPLMAPEDTQPYDVNFAGTRGCRIWWEGWLGGEAVEDIFRIPDNVIDPNAVMHERN